MALTAFCALGIGMLLLAGCAANLDQPERFQGTDTPTAGTSAGGSGAGGTSAVPVAPASVTAVFGKACTTAGACHDKATMSADLDLQSAGVASRLINVTATHSGIANPSACAPAKLIDTSNPAASWLLIKLMGTQSSDCGSAMPFGSNLASADQTTITNWVNSLGTGVSAGGTGGMSAGGSGGGTAVAGSGGGTATGGTGGAAAGGNGGAATAGSGGAATAGSGGSGGASGGASGSAGTGGT